MNDDYYSFLMEKRADTQIQKHRIHLIISFWIKPECLLLLMRQVRAVITQRFSDGIIYPSNISFDKRAFVSFYTNRKRNY